MGNAMVKESSFTKMEEFMMGIGLKGRYTDKGHSIMTRGISLIMESGKMSSFMEGGGYIITALICQMNLLMRILIT